MCSTIYTHSKFIHKQKWLFMSRVKFQCILTINYCTQNNLKCPIILLDKCGNRYNLLLSLTIYLSVKSWVGDPLGAWEGKGSAGDLLLVALDSTGGAGGFLAGMVQKQSAELLFQSPSKLKSEQRKVFCSVPSKPGHPADFPEPRLLKSGTLADGFSFVGKFSSSSNVTHPLGCTFSTLRDLLRKQNVFSAASTGNRGLLVLQLAWGRGGNVWEAAGPASTCEVIPDSCVSVLNGFPALRVLSVNGFEQFSPVINGFRELCWCSCDEWKVGKGGIAGMQFTVFKLSAFLCLAEGHGINSFWFKVGAGDVRTDVCILDTSSWNDRSSKGSLLSWGSGVVPYVPLGFSCKGNNVLRNHAAGSRLFLPLPFSPLSWSFNPVLF